MTVVSNGTNNIPTLTVYDVGQGTGSVMSSPPPPVINCGSGAGCRGHFALNSQVTLIATPNQGSIFGGFFANCSPVLPDPYSCAMRTEALSCTCQLTMTDNATVGAIFD